MANSFIHAQNQLTEWREVEYPNFKRKYTIKQIRALTNEEIGKMSTPQLAELVSVMTKRYGGAKSRIKKSGLFSHAVDKIETISKPDKAGTPSAFATTYRYNKKTGMYEIGEQYKGATHFKLQHRALHLRDFFNSKTSTIKGIKAVNYAQDKHIFGVDEAGNLLGTMTDDERKLYWQIVDEFRMNPTGKVKDYYYMLYEGIIHDLWFKPETRPKSLIEGLRRVNQAVGGNWYIADDYDPSMEVHRHPKELMEKNPERLLKRNRTRNMPGEYYPYGTKRFNENPGRYAEPSKDGDGGLVTVYPSGYILEVDKDGKPII